MSAQQTSAREMETTFERLGAMVRAVETGEVSERVSLAGRERLLASLGKPQRTSGKVVRVAFGGAATTLAAAAAVALFVHVKHAPQPLGWTAENAVAAEDGYVSTVSPDANATLRFTSGARVELAGGSRGRVVDTSASHARVVLEAGRATIHGDAHPQLSFLIEAGPYALKSGGAAYDVTWSGDSLEVRVKAGTVTVQGPLAQGGLTLHRDQVLVAHETDGALQVTTDSDGPHGAADDITSPALPATGATATAASRSPATANAHPNATWAQHVAAGEYDLVLREAESRGLDQSIQKGSLAEVAALADAARYSGHAALAKRTLSAERARFVGSSEARTAAFLLGRIAEDSDGDAGAAIGWYDRYLAEAPRGPLASEALGRKMMLVLRTSGADAAKPIAEQYLRRFPKGSYATVARQHANEP